MAQVFYNNVAGVLSGSHAADALSLTLQAGHNFPDPGADYYLATLILLDSSARETAWEIVRVTDVTGNTVTVVRGQESTTAREWAGNSRIEVRLTAGATESKANLGTAAYTASTAYAPAIGSTVYAPLTSPAFTGNPTAPTATQGDNDTSIATTAFVNAEIAADAVPASFLTSQIGMRNKIINGAFDIWQRGTVFNYGAPYYTADRWAVYAAGTAPSFSREAGVGGFRYCLAWGGVSGNTGISVYHKVESLSAQALVGASAITVTAMLYSSIAKTIGYSLQTPDAQDLFSARTTRSSGTLSHAGAGWQTFTFTYNSPHVDVGNGVFLEFGFGACTTGSFGITGVQLEVGAIATPFEHRPIGMELALCQRYYYRVEGSSASARLGSGHFYTPTNCTALIEFPCVMRVAPSAVQHSGTAGDYGFEYSATGQSATTVPAFILASPKSAVITVAVAYTVSTMPPGTLYANANGFLGFSAEL